MLGKGGGGGCSEKGSPRRKTDLILSSSHKKTFSLEFPWTLHNCQLPSYDSRFCSHCTNPYPLTASDFPRTFLFPSRTRRIPIIFRKKMANNDTNLISSFLIFHSKTKKNGRFRPRVLLVFLLTHRILWLPKLPIEISWAKLQSHRSLSVLLIPTLGDPDLELQNLKLGQQNVKTKPNCIISGMHIRPSKDNRLVNVGIGLMKLREVIGKPKEC